MSALLSIAIDQIQRPTWWITEPRRDHFGRKTTDLRTQRAENLFAICADLSKSSLDEILEVNALKDPRLHRDDARRIMNDMVDNGKLKKTTKVIESRHRVFYEVKTEQS